MATFSSLAVDGKHMLEREDSINHSFKVTLSKKILVESQGAQKQHRLTGNY